MVSEVQGDIVEFVEQFHQSNDGSKALFVIHQANCFNTVSRARGVARVLASYCPALGEVDDNTTKGDTTKLGGYSFAQKYNDVWIFNAYGQYRYGNGKRTGEVFTDYAKLHESLVAIRNSVISHFPNPVFVMPKYIGAGLANGDWNIILNEIIKPVFEGFEITLVYL